MEYEELIEKHLGINTPIWIKEKIVNIINEVVPVKTICNHDFVSCGTRAVECTKSEQIFKIL
jgi:hypothetical protein